MVAGGIHQIVRATVAECVKRRSPMPAYLVVANQTLGGAWRRSYRGLGCRAEVDRPFDDKLQRPTAAIPGRVGWRCRLGVTKDTRGR